MKRLNDLSSDQLRWIRPNRRQRFIYELRSEDEVFAAINWKGFSRASALIESADGSWTITRQGLTQAITIKVASTQMDLAAIKRGITGNVTLSLGDGRVFLWRCTSFWRSIWSWIDVDGRPLAHLKRGAFVQLEAPARDVPELALLLALGWYLYKQQQEEAAVVGAVVAITG